VEGGREGAVPLRPLSIGKRRKEGGGLRRRNAIPSFSLPWREEKKKRGEVPALHFVTKKKKGEQKERADLLHLFRGKKKRKRGKKGKVD